MSALHMLDVAIGIMLVFLLVSLICSVIAEIIESALKQRAADLLQGIKELLQDPNADGIVKRLYEHPLIGGLYKGGFDTKNNLKGLPSYIPARIFALSIIDIIQPSNPVNPAPTNSIEQKQIDKLATVIKNLVAITGTDINKAIPEIENWFNGSMDRVAGWYKRKVQRILIGIGLVVAIAMNVDTIAVFKSLTDDPELRNSLVLAAQEYAKPLSTDSANKQSARQRLEQNSQKLRELRLPIGWDWNKPSELSTDKRYVTNYALAIPQKDNWPFKVLGWLLTAMAVSLGASFWFDALNKIMVIRSTVKPHEKSPEEASEDRQLKPAKRRGA